ncbi:MAG TPA: SDR family oxidoreductase [Dermatophilaceae bacterium]|nr:SDR family oxidoreductase [Dermatophilaceae bacterium]
MPLATTDRRPHPALGPAHVLLTGATGFLGQAVLERLLSDYHQTRVTVLIRGCGGLTPRQRLARLLEGPTFAALHAAPGSRTGAGADSTAGGRVHESIGVIDADLGEDYTLPGDIDAVVHCASSVKFNERVDAAFETNVAGTHRLYSALRCGSTPVHVVHVSTAYVSAGRMRRAPQAALKHDVDWRDELNLARGLGVRVRAEVTRRPPIEPGSFEAEVERRMTALGAARGHELGWTDVYTLTKALGERVAEELTARAGQRLTVLRPTIIESALSRPFPGWIDGFKVADPIIAAYARGRLEHFPGHPDNVLDLIPVDLVVNAILANLANPPEPATPRYVHVASGSDNPLTLQQMFVHASDYFAAHPWIGQDGRACQPPPFRFRGPAAVDRWIRRRERLLALARPMVRAAGSPRAAALADRLAGAARGLRMLREYRDLYAPYTCSRTVFDTTPGVPAGHPDLTSDTSVIDWADYLGRVHLPAVVRLMRQLQATRRVPAATRNCVPRSAQTGRTQQRLKVPEQLR